MTSMYPMPRLRPSTDKRFSSRLVDDLAQVLEMHGFPPVRTGSDLVSLQRHLAAFLYDSGSSAEQTAAATPVRAVGGPPPTRPVPVASGDGSGTPDDWPDAHPSWMDPNHELTHYDQLGVQIDYPEMCSGVFSYTALWRTQ